MPTRLDRKTPISCLYVLKYARVKHSKNDRSCRYDIGLLGTDGTYYEYEFHMRARELNNSSMRRLIEFFQPFRFTPATKVGVSDDVSKLETLMVYLHTLGSQIGFNVTSPSVHKMIRRIIGKKTGFPTGKRGTRWTDRWKRLNGKNFTILNTPALWKRVVEMKLCPWINERLGEEMAEMDTKMRMRKRLVRIFTYYLHVVNIYRAFDKISLEKRRLKEAKAERAQEESAESQAATAVDPPAPEFGIFVR